MRPIHPAVIQITLSILCFTYGATILGTYAHDYSPFSIGLIWYAAAAAGSFLFLAGRKKLGSEMRTIHTHIKQSAPVLALGTLDGLFWFFSLLLLGLAGSAIAGRIGLVILAAYSLLVLKEKYSKQDIFCMAMMIAASALFAYGLDFTREVIGYILAVGAALAGAGFVITKKHTADRIHGVALQMIRAFFIWISVLVLFFVMPAHPLAGVSIPFVPALLIASGGISNAIFGQFFRMKAFNSGGNLGMVTMVQAAGPLLTFSIGFLVLHEPGNIWKYTAATLMFTAMFALTWSNTRRKKTISPPFK